MWAICSSSINYVLAKDKQFLLLISHPLCCSYSHDALDATTDKHGNKTTTQSLRKIRYIAKVRTHYLVYCNWGSSYQERRVVILFICLSPQHECACPKPRPEFPVLYIVCLFCVLWVEGWLLLLLLLVELLPITVYTFFSSLHIFYVF
jgi:hypothetical protein